MAQPQNAAKALNDTGQRNGQRKFQSGDISATIDSVKIDDVELMEVACFLLKGGRIFAVKLYN